MYTDNNINKVENLNIPAVDAAVTPVLTALDQHFELANVHLNAPGNATPQAEIGLHQSDTLSDDMFLVECRSAKRQCQADQQSLLNEKELQVKLSDEHIGIIPQPGSVIDKLELANVDTSIQLNKDINNKEVNVLTSKVEQKEKLTELELSIIDKNKKTNKLVETRNNNKQEIMNKIDNSIQRIQQDREQQAIIEKNKPNKEPLPTEKDVIASWEKRADISKDMVSGQLKQTNKEIQKVSMNTKAQQQKIEDRISVAVDEEEMKRLNSLIFAVKENNDSDINKLVSRNL